VLVTSKADREMKIQGLELGADDYVTKPFHPSELLARVRSLLRVSGLQREVTEKNETLERINSELNAALSDLKEAESALVQSERLAAVGELAAGVAHEVNNPVNFATNALSALSEYVSDVCDVASKVDGLDFNDSGRLEKKVAELAVLKEKLGFGEISGALGELVEIVTEGLDRTQRLVGDLQHFASPAMKAIGMVGLGDSVESTLQLVRYSARERNVKLHSDVEQNLPPVHGCRQSLNQVFLNLVKNAIEAAAPIEGNVWVAVRRIEADVVVEVADDGAGIAVEDMGRVFEPFFSTKTAGSGTGLGLSISKRVVRDHGGEITCRPRRAGGAVFTVAVPLRSLEGSDVNEA
jgi:hypothetical protein